MSSVPTIHIYTDCDAVYKPFHKGKLHTLLSTISDAWEYWWEQYDRAMKRGGTVQMHKIKSTLTRQIDKQNSDKQKM